jgi:hypothetical protein
MAMTSGWKIAILLLVVLVTAAAASGCLTDRIDLVATGVVAVESHHCKQVSFSKISIYQEGEHLVIQGKIKRNYFCICPSCKGFVEVELVDADGELLGIYPAATSPRNLPRKGPRESSFSIREKMKLPEGSSARIHFNRGRCFRNRKGSPAD